jgi:hypothetical protein
LPCPPIPVSAPVALGWHGLIRLKLGQRGGQTHMADLSAVASRHVRAWVVFRIRSALRWSTHLLFAIATGCAGTRLRRAPHGWRRFVPPESSGLFVQSGRERPPWWAASVVPAASRGVAHAPTACPVRQDNRALGRLHLTSRDDVTARSATSLVPARESHGDRRHAEVARAAQHARRAKERSTPRNARPSRRRFFGSPRSCQGSPLRSDPIRGSRP